MFLISLPFWNSLDLVLPGCQGFRWSPNSQRKDSVFLGPLFCQTVFRKFSLNPSCCCLQYLQRLGMPTIHLELSPPPWELVTAQLTQKIIRLWSAGTGPSTSLPFCAVLSPDDFREGEGGVQWMPQTFPPLSPELPIYFLWQFAQIVKILCNYCCIWNPNMIYTWQAQSSLGWLGVCMCICMHVCTCIYVGYVFLCEQSRY